ncbi:myeloid-associated differentiation marker homolog [Eublepharis macularius]|uniref:Myeloid-associated differentiation marker homolog n=1 Tax=Eublepharis macularius TaxID=481883 RepID=A0AA97K4H1_EUBMA|nr:myeloid-associated differentiation marker homolog [Eublepharis macularius]
MPALELNTRSLISPLGVVRFFEVFFACTAFSLVSVYHSYNGSNGVWCMFTWCFCFVVTLLIILVEFIGLAQSLPLSWQDFTSAFSMLAALMTFTTSVVYPSVFIANSCSGRDCAYKGSATAMSCLCFIAYAIEVGLTRAKSGEVSSFLATVPGLLKVFEAYVACLIFSLVDFTKSYRSYAGLQWCVAVYCICFIITMFIIILTVGRCLASLPFPLEKALVAYNFLAVLMYITATFVWPIYSFRDFSRTYACNAGLCREWNNRLGVTFLTIFNLIAYIVDLVYSSKMVFVTTPA